MIRVTIYNEFVHERTEEKVREVYPDGIHMALKSFLEDGDVVVDTVTLDTVNELTEEKLKDTDVLVWWGHMAHNKVPDEVAEHVKEAVQRGMGDSKHPLWFVGVACVGNIILDYVLVGPLKMGAAGAAWATIIAQAVSLILAAWYLKKKGFVFDFKLKSFALIKNKVKLLFQLFFESQDEL